MVALASPQYAKVIAEDKRAVAYRPILAKLTGSATAAVLLQQILFHFDNRDNQPFYKFKQPCESCELYREGDSWCEELGFTRSEFDTALDKIGTKVTQGRSKKTLLSWSLPLREHWIDDDRGYGASLVIAIQHLVIYWTDSSRVTWYQVNTELLNQILCFIYEAKAEILLYLEKARNQRRLDKAKSRVTSNTENTREYSENTKNIADASSDAPPTPPIDQHIVSAVPDNSAEPQGETSSTPVAIQEKALGNPPQKVPLKSSPLPPLAPPGYRWLVSSVSDSLMHLIPSASNDKFAKALCKANVPHRVAWSPLMDKPTCAECVRIANEPPKPKERSRKPASDLTDAMHNAIPESIRPPGNPHYGKNIMPAEDVLSAGFTVQDVTEYVTWAYQHDKWYCCGGAGGTPVLMSMFDVKKNIKGWKVTQSKGMNNGTADAQQSASAPATATAASNNGREPGVLGQRSQVISKAEWGRYSEQSKRKRG
jgi:hypothetical protein